MSTDTSPLKNGSHRRIQLKLLEYHVEPTIARSLAQVEFCNWNPDRLDAILRKSHTTHGHLRHFSRDLTSVNGQPLDGDSWVSAPPALIERCAKEKLTLCVNASGEWKLCSESFVAISHVWNEGIQADNGNRGLAKTTLDSIFAVLKPLNVSWIWLDCLSIPGGNRTLTAKQEFLKKDIINNLANIYLKADAVIVFDARVRKLESLDLVEVAVVLLCGQWMTRLWTLQEICLASNGLVMTAFGSVKFKDIIRALCYLSGNQQTHEDIVGPMDSQLLQMIKHEKNKPLFECIYIRLVRLFRFDEKIPSLTSVALSCYGRQTGNDIDYARAFFPLLGLEWKVQNSREEGMNEIYDSQMYYAKRMILMHGSPRSTFRPGWAPSYLTGLHGPILSPDDPLGDIEWEKRGLKHNWYTYKVVNHGPANDPSVMILSIQSAEKDPVLTACRIDARETEESRNCFLGAITQGEAFLLSNRELAFPTANGLAINCILVERDAEVEHADEAWVCFTTEVLAMQGRALFEVHPWLLLHESPISTHLLSGKGHSRICRMMDYEGDPNHSEAPLLVAIRSGDFQQFQKVLATPVDLQVMDSRGCTPLHIAVLFGRTQMLDELLDRKVTLDAQNRTGRTPLNLAAEKGISEIVQRLLARGADPNLCPSDEPGTLNQAILKCHYEIIGMLLLNGAEVNKKDEWKFYPLHYASRDYKATSMLLDAGADHNIDLVGGAQLIHFAARAGQIKTVEMLLDRGVGVDRREGGGYDSKEPTALYRAIEEQQESTVELLMRRGANPNLIFKNAWTCTLMAAQSGNVNILQHLLHHHPLRFRDACLPEGWTALHLCVEKGYRIPTKMLLEAGWDCTTVDAKGRTAAVLAQEQGRTSVMETLRVFAIEHWASVNESHGTLSKSS